MNWLHYLIEANIYLGVFYLCYCLFLNRDTHYTLSRVYLIFSCVIAFVLPVTQLSILKPVIPEIEIEEPITAFPVHLSPVSVRPVQIAAPVKHITFDDALVYLYIAGVVVALFVLMFRLRKLYILTRNNNALNADSYKLVKLSDENTAFSFFNYLFIGNNVPQPETIIAHELVHIRQKHSADIIFLEVVKIVNWFNPFIYLIQRSLKTIHEYIADEQTAAHEQDALAYSSFLLNNAYGIQGNSIAHSFFNYNLLKKRIIMLNKNRSGKLARLKYLAALPLCAGMLCASTLVFSKDYGFIDLAPQKAVVIKPVIDSAKYTLKVTEKRSGITVISDKMVHTDEKTGKKTTYTAANLTPEKQAEALKNGGFIVERIIRTDSATHTLQLTAPDGTKGTSDIVVVEDAKTNFKHTYKVNTLSDNDKKELKAMGYNIAIIERPKEWADTGKRLPPPPPAPPIQKRMPPPPPPLAPLKTSFQDFGSYLNMTVKYPKAAFDKKSQGSVLFTFSVDKNGHLGNVKLTGNQRMGFDDALLNSVNAYKDQIKDKPGDYTMMVNFIILGAKPVTFPSPAKPGNYVGEVDVLGMTAEQRKRLTPPPPPPAPPKKLKDQVKLPPPPPAPPKVSKIASPVIEKALPAVAMTPQNTAIQALYSHLGKTIKYPKEARDVKKEGRVIVTFNVNQGKMENIQVVRSVSPEIDREVVKSLNSFNKPLPLEANTYSIPLLFTLDTGIQKPAEVREYPLIAYKAPTGKATGMALNEIVIVGYAN